MSLSVETAVLIALAVLAANLPFLSQRLFFVGPKRQPKLLAWRLLEWLVLYFVVGAIGLWMEHQAGQISPQRWEFYAVTASMFLTLAFPGFVYRYLAQRESAH